MLKTSTVHCWMVSDCRYLRDLWRLLLTQFWRPQYFFPPSILCIVWWHFCSLATTCNAIIAINISHTIFFHVSVCNWHKHEKCDPLLIRCFFKLNNIRNKTITIKISQYFLYFDAKELYRLNKGLMFYTKLLLLFSNPKTDICLVLED